MYILCMENKIKKNCKECPWVVRNKNNDTIINHSKRLNKKHNCHMLITGTNKKLWTLDPEFECFGSMGLVSTCNINK